MMSQKYIKKIKNELESRFSNLLQRSNADVDIERFGTNIGQQH
jgi:hypothetical protein